MAHTIAIAPKNMRDFSSTDWYQKIAIFCVTITERLKNVQNRNIKSN
jgi:hypothetical protein